MAYNSRSLFTDATRAGCAKEDPEKVGAYVCIPGSKNKVPHAPHYFCYKVWNALGLYVDECLRMGKGLKVPKLGSFTTVKNSVRDPAPGIKRRIFCVAPTFARSYGVPVVRYNSFSKQTLSDRESFFLVRHFSFSRPPLALIPPVHFPGTLFFELAA